MSDLRPKNNIRVRTSTSNVFASPDDADAAPADAADPPATPGVDAPPPGGGWTLPPLPSMLPIAPPAAGMTAGVAHKVLLIAFVGTPEARVAGINVVPIRKDSNIATTK